MKSLSVLFGGRKLLMMTAVFGGSPTIPNTMLEEENSKAGVTWIVVMHY